MCYTLHPQPSQQKKGKPTKKSGKGIKKIKTCLQKKLLPVKR